MLLYMVGYFIHIQYVLLPEQPQLLIGMKIRSRTLGLFRNWTSEYRSSIGFCTKACIHAFVAIYFIIQNYVAEMSFEAQNMGVWFLVAAGA